MDRYGKIEGMEDIVDLIDELGFLPFFRNPIEGWSLEEKTPPEFWFNDDNDGDWEWKGPIISRSESAYGKFYRGKAVWISRGWYPDFVNYRRFRRHLTADEKFILETLKGEGFAPLEGTQGLHGLQPPENESDRSFRRAAHASQLDVRRRRWAATRRL